MARAGVMMRFWSPVGGACGADARRHQLHLMTDDLAQAGRLLGRTDQAVDSEYLRLLGAGLNQIRDAEPVAGCMQITVVIGGEHGDGEDLQIRTRAGFDGSLHGLWVGMHRQKCCAERGDTFDAARNGVADIVQLEIDEDLLARADNSRTSGKPPA